MAFERLSILGFGLLGASIAKAVEQRITNCVITANDLQPQQIKPYLGPRLRIAATAAEAVEGADCIILCIPPEQVHTLLDQIRSAIPATAIITDVASVKRQIVSTAEATLLDPSRFVGGHPMAGGERSGSANARADLFERAAVVLTPTSSTDPSAVDAVQAFWEQLGGRVHRMSADEHDRAMATVSHFPHVLAAALMHIVPSHAEAIVGPGFRDMTRIAAGDPELWRQILISNADQVSVVLQSMRRQLDEVDQLLNPAQQAELQKWLATAAAGRQKLNVVPR